MIIKCRVRDAISVAVHDQVYKQKIVKMKKKTQIKSTGCKAKSSRFCEYGSLEVVL